MEEYAKPTYEPIVLEAFHENLQTFPLEARVKIEDKCINLLCNYPYRFPMLKGEIKVKGLKFTGLRHMKVGVQGVKGGAFILYRICEECKKNDYAVQSGVKCEFCNGKDKHVVLFATHIRSYGY
jgi:hypothetical protein